MPLPNPDMLDSSISNVVALLPNEDKIDVLLYAMGCLPADGREVIETAVEPLFHTPFNFQDHDKIIQARLLRAKSRIPRGLHDAVDQDLQAILLLNPNHREARELLLHIKGMGRTETGDVTVGPGPSESLKGWPYRDVQDSKSLTQKQLQLPNEIWREIASFLPRSDLRSLICVPHVLSPIARQLLFRSVSLTFNTSGFCVEVDSDDEDPVKVEKRHARQSAEILCHLITDPECASQVTSLVVTAPDDREHVLFPCFIVMLSAVIKRLTHLKVFECVMNDNEAVPLLEILEKHHPNLESLLIGSTSLSLSPPPLPRFGRLNGFYFASLEDVGAIPDIQSLLTIGAVSLRTLVIYSPAYQPQSPLSISNLRELCLSLTISNAYWLSQLLESGQQLEILRLDVRFGGSELSSAFRSHAQQSSLPKLSGFSFILLGVTVHHHEDRDLFPAVAEFVRGHPMLEVLCLSYRESQRDPEDFGYTAAIWDVLPPLVHLRALSMDASRDLPPGPGGLLVPRSVVALDVRVLEGASWEVDCAQLLQGVPNGLKFLGIPSITDLKDDILPALRLVFSSGFFQVVCQTDNGREFRRLGRKPEECPLGNLLRELNCEEVSLFFDLCALEHLWRFLT